MQVSTEHCDVRLKGLKAGAEAQGVGEVAAGDKESDAAVNRGLFEEGGRGGRAGWFGDDIGVLVEQADGFQHLVVGDKYHVIDQFADDADVFRFGRARGEPIGDGVAAVSGNASIFFPRQIIRWSAFRLNAENLDARIALLDGSGEAADKRGVSHGDVDRSDFRELLENF